MKVKATYVTGCAPNLPWWRIITMTEEQIKAYNDKFLHYETSVIEDGPRPQDPNRAFPPQLM